MKHIRETAFDVAQFARECTPGYFNNEGDEKFCWYLGESYGPGVYVFEKLMQDWRARGGLEGFVIKTQ